MSAECGRCGADLVYAEWPEMYCARCDSRTRIHALLQVLEAAREVGPAGTGVDALFAAIDAYDKLVEER